MAVCAVMSRAVTKIAVLVIWEFVLIGFGSQVYTVSDVGEHDPDGFCFL